MKRKSMRTALDTASDVDEFALVSPQCSDSGPRVAAVADAGQAQNLCAKHDAAVDSADEFAYVVGTSDLHPGGPLSDEGSLTSARTEFDDFAVAVQSGVLHASEEDVMSDAEASVSTSSSEEECVNAIMEYLFVEEPLDAAPCTEPDAFMCCAGDLSKHMRSRPTIPCSRVNAYVHTPDSTSGIAWPLFSCPFKACGFGTDDRRAFEEHILHTSGPHAKLLADVVGKYKASLGFDCASARWRASLLSESIAIKERAGFPLTGLCVTRRTLRNIARNYNDESVQALMCCVCGERCLYLQRQAWPPGSNPDISKYNGEINFKSAAWLICLEQNRSLDCVRTCLVCCRVVVHEPLCFRRTFFSWSVHGVEVLVHY